LQGTLLGWSVAWPPGPVNLEIIRRGTSRGFLAGWLVGCGASSGDFFWALLTNTGAGVIAKNPTLKLALGVVSTIFLVMMVTMLVKSWMRRQRGEVVTAETSPSSRNGFLVGLGISATSPWNATFWLAIAGQGTSFGAGPVYSLLLAGSVMLGAAAWVVLLASLASFGRGRIGEKWQRHSELAAAALMLFFAIQSIFRLASV
jgi:threonine/homoserine/homoserine lactone efflux protein